MGVFRIECDTSVFLDHLLKLGFIKDLGPRGEKGYTRFWFVENGSYCIWVTMNLRERKMYIYKEYSVGGLVGEAEYDLENEWFANLDIFIDEIDDILSDWISEDE